VSGISTVAQNIIQYNKGQKYYHYLLGRSDKPTGRIRRLLNILEQIIVFPFFIKDNKIDVVHQNLPLDPKGVMREFLINSWCRIMNIPVLLHVHGGIFLMNGTKNVLFRFLIKSMLRHSQRVIVLSELEKEALLNNYRYSTAHVLYNSVDTAQYPQRDKEVTKKKHNFLFLGRINESKGIEDIIEAFKLIEKEMDFHFILCGDGPLKEKIIAECAAILGKNFEYLGVVSGKEKIEVICRSEYFLLPSRYGEGLPMALLETMAAGVVPIVTDDASMKYVVRHAINGIRINKKDPIDLSEKIKYVIAHPDIYHALSMKARNTIVEKFDIKDYIHKLNEIYNDIYLNRNIKPT
jgi:glycosyltransferase involved in cell wall biosynthesis